MAHPETDRVSQVFYPIEDNLSAPKCKPAPFIAKFASLTATNYAVANNPWHSVSSKFPITAPQVSEERGDICDKDSGCENPAEFTRGDALDSAKSHSSATSSSMDGVFLTAPETPTESVDHDFRPQDLLDSYSETYNGVEGPKDTRAIVPTSPTPSKTTKSENSSDGSRQCVSANCDSQEAAMTEQEVVSQASSSDIRDAGSMDQITARDVGSRSMSLQEESITGVRLGVKPDIVPIDNPAFSQTRRRNRVVQTPRSSRRHAIPIIRPSTPGAEEPPSEHYDHGLDGVPSHYIPLYGSSHGMFYDLITKMFIGDGPPRRTPERPDGTMPCMPENARLTAGKMANAPKNSTAAETADKVNTKSVSRTAVQRKYPDDILHIQPRSFIDDFNLVPQPEGESLPLGYSAPDNGTYPFGRPSNKKSYFCRCTGEWHPTQHQCTRGPLENMPEQSGLAITSQTQLPDGWVTHRIAVDLKMYPGGVMPEQTPAGPMVGEQPAKYFTSVSETGTHPRTAEAARAAAFAITQSRGASQVRALRRGAANSDAKAPLPPVPRSSNNSSLPIRSSEINQSQTQSAAKDNNNNNAADISQNSVFAASASGTDAPIIAAAGPTTTTPTTPSSTTTTSNPPTTTITTSNPTPAVAAAPDLSSTPSPPQSTTSPSDPSDPSATTTPTRALGRPATKVAGQRRQGKGSCQSRKGH